MTDPADLALLRCPAPGCGAPIADKGDDLGCDACGARWGVHDGLPALYRPDLVRGNDRLLQFFYQNFSALHDLSVRLLVPLFQTEGSERALRDAYVRRMALDALTPHADGAPVRILEVGAGTGANLALVRDALPPGLPVEYWAMDLSASMLGELRARVARDPAVVPGGDRIRLALADAHALPYASHSFDRVFQIGAVGNYRDPARALAEMARVAKPGTPIVVVDEQLDPTRKHSPYHRLAFRAVTFYDRDPHCPREHVPVGAVDVVEEAASRFFYCLSFRMPA